MITEFDVKSAQLQKKILLDLGEKVPEDVNKLASVDLKTLIFDTDVFRSLPELKGNEPVRRKVSSQKLHRHTAYRVAGTKSVLNRKRHVTGRPSAGKTKISVAKVVQDGSKVLIELPTAAVASTVAEAFKSSGLLSSLVERITRFTAR